MKQFIELVGGVLDGKRTPMQKVFLPNQYWTTCKELFMQSETGLIPYKFESVDIGEGEEVARYVYDKDRHLNPLI